MTAFGPIASSAIADIWHGQAGSGFLGSFSTPTRKKLSAAVIATTITAFVPYPTPQPSAGWQTKWEAPRAKSKRFSDGFTLPAFQYNQPFGWYGAFSQPRSKGLVQDQTGGWHQPSFVTVDTLGWYEPWQFKRNKPLNVALLPWPTGPYLHYAPFDVFVETPAEARKRRKLEKRAQKEFYEAIEEETRWRQQRRLDIAKAVIGPTLVSFTWIDRPAVTVWTPQTANLSKAIVEAKGTLEGQKLSKLEQEEDEDLAFLLGDL